MVFFELALGIIAIGVAVAYWTIIKNSLYYYQIIQKYKIYKIVEALEKRGINIKDLNEVVEESKKGKFRNPLDTIDDEYSYDLDDLVEETKEGE